VSKHRRFLDQPYLVEVLAIEAMQDKLRVLANYSLTPLPQRLRSRFAGMHVRLHAIKRELERRPDAIANERAAEDRRGGD
jgi:hypothetical protein